MSHTTNCVFNGFIDDLNNQTKDEVTFGDWTFGRDDNDILWAYPNKHVDGCVPASIVTCTPFYVHSWRPRNEDSTDWCIGLTWTDPNGKEHSHEYSIGSFMVDAYSDNVLFSLAADGFIIYNHYMFKQYLHAYLFKREPFWVDDKCSNS